MSNILVINGAKQFAHSNGELNDTLTALATDHLTELGHDVQVTRTDSDYNAEAEVEKFLWADVVITRCLVVDGCTVDSKKIY